LPELKKKELSRCRESVIISLRRASFTGLNGGGFQGEGAAEGGCGGNSAAPERSAGAKRRRSVVRIGLVKGSDFVQGMEP